MGDAARIAAQPFDGLGRVPGLGSETNLLGPVRISAAFIEHLKRQPPAYLINNSSALAFIPIAVTALYSATKAAIHSYTLSRNASLIRQQPGHLR